MSAIRVQLPDDATAELPRQYVASLADTSIAEIVPHLPPAESLNVEQSGMALEWTLRDFTLRVSRERIFGAAIERREFMGQSFASFNLCFGVDSSSGSVSLLTAPLSRSVWFRQFARELEPLIPGGISDNLNEVA